MATFKRSLLAGSRLSRVLFLLLIAGTHARWSKAPKIIKMTNTTEAIAPIPTLNMTLVNKNRTLVKRIEAEGADKTDKTNPKSTRALADSNVLDMRAREVGEDGTKIIEISKPESLKMMPENQSISLIEVNAIPKTTPTTPNSRAEKIRQDHHISTSGAEKLKEENPIQFSQAEKIKEKDVTNIPRAEKINENNITNISRAAEKIKGEDLTDISPAEKMEEKNIILGSVQGVSASGNGHKTNLEMWGEQLSRYFQDDSESEESKLKTSGTNALACILSAMLFVLMMGELIIICNIRKCGLWMCCSVMDPNRRPQTSWDAEVRNVQFSAEVMTFAASLGNHDKDELKGGMQGEDEEGTEAPESNESNTQTSILIQSAQPLGIGFDFDSKCPPTRMARTVEMPSLIS